MITWLVFLLVFAGVTFFLSKSIWNMALSVMELQVEVLRLKEKIGDNAPFTNLMTEIGRELGQSKSEEEEAQDDH